MDWLAQQVEKPATLFHSRRSCATARSSLSACSALKEREGLINEMRPGGWTGFVREPFVFRQVTGSDRFAPVGIEGQPFVFESPPSRYWGRFSPSPPPFAVLPGARAWGRSRCAVWKIEFASPFLLPVAFRRCCHNRKPQSLQEAQGATAENVKLVKIAWLFLLSAVVDLRPGSVLGHSNLAAFEELHVPIQQEIVAAIKVRGWAILCSAAVIGIYVRPNAILHEGI